MKTLLLAATSLTLFGASTPLHVGLDIYSNKAFLKKSYDLNQSEEITTNIPQNLGLEQIRFKLEEGCKINSSQIKKVDNKEQKLEISYKINALKAKEVLLKTMSLKDTKDSNQVENMTNLLVENLTKNMLDIAKLNKELKDLNKQSKELEIAFTCKRDNKKLEIIYPLNSIKYTPFYNISANINNKSLSIEKKATLFYKGLESYENIDLNIYSYRYNHSVSPQRFYPKYLGEQRKVVYTKAKMATSMDSIAEKSFGNNAPIQHKNLATKSRYEIKGVNLKANEKNLLNVDREVIDASFKTVIDAYGSNRAYMEVTVQTKKDYSGGSANFLLNQNPISSSYINRIQKNKKTKLYFGEDEHIQVKKELVKTLDEKTFFGDKKISTQNWKYTITNTKPYSTDIEFIARVPVSKDGDIKVKTLAQPKFDSQSTNGKTTWNFKLKQNSKKEIIFGYEVFGS